jgi:hypothetical protein
MMARLIGVPDSPALGRHGSARVAVSLVSTSILLFLFSACTPAARGDLPPAANPPTPPPLTVRSTITYEPPGDVHLSSLRFVSVEFAVTGAGANDLATVELVAPSSSPYETRAAVFTGPVFEEQRLEFPLAVGGTVIETAVMTGSWKALLLVNGQVAASLPFDINP